MEFKQCSKCQNELPFSAESNEITCPFCGAVNRIENQKFNVSRASNKPCDDATAGVIAASIASDSGSDC